MTEQERLIALFRSLSEDDRLLIGKLIEVERNKARTEIVNKVLDVLGVGASDDEG